jgi:LPPG:FO 2-phospho-L-lactate transferase
LKVVAFAGGVGGAKLADGLAQVLDPNELTIIVNVGDDFDYLGMHICPDLDTVCYTLAGIANPETGWGLRNETWNAYKNLLSLGGPSWFHLGDTDLGTHLERTRRLTTGERLSSITRSFCQAWGVRHLILPASDDRIPTIVHTVELGDLAFQKYFVEQQCSPQVTGFDFQGIDLATPAPGVLDALNHAEGIIICPSNPWVSISPILAIPGIRDAMTNKPLIAISPIVGGKAIKGPAAKMYAELGWEASALSVARHYGTALTGFVLDEKDQGLLDDVRQSGIIPYVTNTIMLTPVDRRRLAEEVLAFLVETLRRNPTQ